MKINYIFYFSTLILVVVYFLVTRKSDNNLGKRDDHGSEIITTKYKKYKSIKDLPKIKENLGKMIIVAYFNHSQCAGCNELTPKFVELSRNSNYQNVKFVSINPINDNIDFMSIGVMFVPAVLIFDMDGDLSKNVIGLINGSAESVIEEVAMAI